VIGCRHDAPLCEECGDTEVVVDPRSADEDGIPDLLPCPRCTTRALPNGPLPSPLYEDDLPW
jgi:hypothetical protein